VGLEAGFARRLWLGWGGSFGPNSGEFGYGLGSGASGEGGRTAGDGAVCAAGLARSIGEGVIDFMRKV